MTTEELNAATDLDCRIRRTGGAWIIECRALGIEASVPEGLPETARAVQGAASDEAKGLAVTAALGFLTVVGRRRLDRLRALLTLVAPLCTPATP